MLSRLRNISLENSQQNLFWGFGIIVLLSIFAGIITEYYFLAGIPAVLLLGFLTVVDFRRLFFILMLLIPLSTEVYLPGGLGTDLPDEPLMVLLTGVFLLYLLRSWKEIPQGFYRHPITLLLVLHISWIFITVLTSSMVLVSVKYLLAKLWYVIPFYFLAGHLLKTEKDVRQLFWWVFIPLVITMSYIIVRHAGYGFSFADVNKVMNPFYRNHVNYACILTLFFPFVWYARFWYPERSRRWWWLLGAVFFFLLAIQLTYTRAAYVSLIGAVGVFFVVRYRLMRWVLLIASIVAVVGVGYLMEKNRYLDYAPDYNRTVTHYEFDNLLEATYKGEDISTMERVYRWVAGVHMNEAKPWLGFGPGNFYNFYRSYTLDNFETYVSDNPEQSGIHCYYLMVLVEQGFPGMLLFILLSFYVLIRGEQVYHNAKDPATKRLVMMVLLTIVIIDAILLINDMVESDKVGPFLFVSMAILVNLDLQTRPGKKKLTKTASS